MSQHAQAILAYIQTEFLVDSDVETFFD